MLKLAATILGEDYNILKQSSVKARQKVLTIFSLLLLPMGLWALTAFTASTVIFEASTLSGIIAASIAASVIFLIDRAFLNAHSASFWLKVFRLGIVILSCGIGSLSIDAVLFKEDVHQQIEKIQLAEVKENTAERYGEEQSVIDDLKVQRGDKQAEVAELYASFTKEVNGEQGTGNAGYGKVAKMREAKWEKAKAELAELDQQVLTAEKALTDKIATDLENGTMGDGGFLLHVRGMFAAIGSDRYIAGIWFAIFIFVMLLEYAPLYVKTKYDETDYDRWKEQEERMRMTQVELHRMQTDRLLRRNQSYTDEDHEAMQMLKRV